MAHLRRLLGWTIFAGFLVAVGFGVFQFVRYRPRCEFVGPANHLYLSPDGARLLTLEGTRPNAGRGPWRVWDTRRGRVVRELGGNAAVPFFEVSPDGRHLAMVLDDGVLRLVDWQAGSEVRLEAERVQQFQFSPKGRWLFVGATKNADDHVEPGLFRSLADRQMVYEAATEQKVLQTDETFFHSGNERFLFVRNWGERDLTVWDIAAGKKVTALPAESTVLAASPDQRRLAAWRRDQSGLEVWDLAAAKLLFERATDQTSALQVVFSPTNRTLAQWHRQWDETADLEVLDATTGQLQWRFAMKGGLDCKFLAGGDLLCLLHGYSSQKPDLKTLTMFDVGSGRVLWNCAGGTTMQFAGDAKVLVHVPLRDNVVQFLDARTGHIVATTDFDVQPRSAADASTRDGRHMLLQGRQSRGRPPRFWEGWLEKWWPKVFGDHLLAVTVMETATGRELFRLHHYGWEQRMLSEDGSTLVTVDAAEGDAANRFVTRVWDVPPTRALIWAIGAAAVVGMGMTALRWVRRKCRRSQAVAPSKQTDRGR